MPQKISEYIDYAKDHKPVTDSDTQVVQVIGVGTAPYTTAQVEGWLAEFKDSGVPVLVVWIDYSGIGQIRYAYVNMSKSQAQALLESEGFSGCSNGTCESYNGDLQGLANGIYIQGSNPDDPPESDGNDDSPICFGGYCIESKRLQYVTGHKDR